MVNILRFRHLRLTISYRVLLVFNVIVIIVVIYFKKANFVDHDSYHLTNLFYVAHTCLHYRKAKIDAQSPHHIYTQNTNFTMSSNTTTSRLVIVAKINCFRKTSPHCLLTHEQTYDNRSIVRCEAIPRPLTSTGANRSSDEMRRSAPYRVAIILDHSKRSCCVWIHIWQSAECCVASCFY